MKDITILYLTTNEIPEFFTNFQIKTLLDAIGDTPIISISRKPIDLGTNLLDTEEKSYINIYRQILRGAQLATTEYIGIAEDDTLYPKEHFELRPPDKDTFLYNQNRFALFTWGVPTYSWRNRKSNCSLIAPRELLIEALEERFAKYPDNTMPKQYVGELGRERIEKGLGVKPRKSVEVFSEVSIIQINHDNGTEDRQKRHRKALGKIKCYDIYKWGKASDLINNMKLDELALKFGTDKSSKEHNYTPIYEELLKDKRDKILKVLEIGVKKGASLLMWQDYFPNAKIYGIDIENRTIEGERIYTIVADQSNKDSLLNVMLEIAGDFDIIIDDGSHKKDHQLLSLETLLPFLKDDGLYIIEDLYDDTFSLKGYKHWFATAGNSIPKGKRCGNTLAIIKK